MIQQQIVSVKENQTMAPATVATTQAPKKMVKLASLLTAAERIQVRNMVALSVQHEDGKIEYVHPGSQVEDTVRILRDVHGNLIGLPAVHGG